MSCVAKRAASNQMNGKHDVKEEAVDTEDVPPSPPSETSDEGDRKKRTRLTHGQKLKVLQLHGEKLQIAEIARRFCCSERTIYRLIRGKDALEEKAKAYGYNKDTKSFRGCRFPEVCFL